MRGFGAFVRALAGNAARLGGRGAADGPLTLVLGNESADLDSIVSSIVLAYALTLAAGSGAGAAIPVINARRADMALRPECDLLLRTTLAAEGGGSGVGDLTFLDDIDLAAMTQRYAAPGGASGDGRLDVWLVDHNAPASRLAALEPFVRGIVDHHVDEGRCLHATWRQITPVGSCATLVAARLRELTHTAGPGVVDAPLAKLLLAAILVDTSNLNPAAQRATDTDIENVDWLASLVDWRQPAATVASDADAEADIPSLDVGSTAELYRVLDKLKGHVSHLSAEDLLRKDYKQWEVPDAAGRVWTVGISSVSYRLRKWLKRDGRAGIETAVGAWIASQGLDLALVMTHGKAKEAKGGDKVYGRDLTVAFAPGSTTPGQRQQVLQGLRGAECLGLRSYFGSGASADDQALGTCFFVQTRTESSRKQVFPAVKAVVAAVS
ncbi:Exopolyphosphatase [Coemansia nantahalensis]|nr:Exopolyphosphatase [Coemansia nantahalensis]